MFTLFLQVHAHPGLLRLITWVLTGLEVEVMRAALRTDLATGVLLYLIFVSGRLVTFLLL